MKEEAYAPNRTFNILILSSPEWSSTWKVQGGDRHVFVHFAYKPDETRPLALLAASTSKMARLQDPGYLSTTGTNQ